MLLELDARVHFSWKLLGREPKSAEELLGVYGALLAAGTGLESRGVARMIHGVDESTIRRYIASSRQAIRGHLNFRIFMHAKPPQALD